MDFKIFKCNKMKKKKKRLFIRLGKKLINIEENMKPMNIIHLVL